MPRGREVIDERFTLEQLAGFGGMGHVYRARDRISGGWVAVKVMHDAERLELGRFAREAQILATLSHPGIVRYVDSGITAEGEPYLVMEWLTGEPLSASLRQGQLTLAEACALGRRVASALSAIHRRGVVHRDIKPSNLFLRDGAIDKVVLIDFGMARRPLTDPNLTVTAEMLDTPGYIAPEQVYNEPNLDGRADVFSLGCVLYRCLSGRAPFRGPDALRVLLNGTPEQLPGLRELRPSIPRELDQLVARMLSRSPDDRPPSADAVAEELLAINEHEDSAIRAPAEPRPIPEILSAERRLVCMVLAQLPDGTDPRPTGEDADDPRQALHDVAIRHRGKLEILPGGLALVILSNADAATDLASRAARCALAIHRSIESRAVVLATGREVLGPVLTTSALFHRATALLETAAPGTVRIDGLTSALLENRFELSYTDGQLRGELREPDRMRLVFHTPTPCVGRDQELEQLETIFDQCVDERAASIVLVSGPPGAGKSRLGHELLRRLRARGCPIEIWFGEANPMHATTAFGLLGQVLRRAVGLDGEPLEVRRDRLRTWLDRRPSGGARFVEILGELVGTPFDGEEPGDLTAMPQRRMLPSDQLGHAFLSLLRAECAAQPVVIVLDDLQWGDLPTIKLLYAARRTLSDQPLMVLALARTQVHEMFPQLWADRCVQEIRLGRLPRRACEFLVRHTLGDAVKDTDLRTLIEHSDRHAAYLEALIRAAAETAGSTTPQTVLAMLQAKLERLDPAARQVLRAASLFGETFWLGGVEAILGTGDIAAWLSVLVEERFVAVHDGGRFPAEVERRFQHPLLCQIAREMLTEEDRAAAQRIADQWLEQAMEASLARGSDPPRDRGSDGGSSSRS